MAEDDQASGVRIVPYDCRALEIFEQVKQFICSIIPYQIEVEHIGSTAVMGLGGKGIIDILIVTNREYLQRLVQLLECKGYKYNPQAETGPERFFLSGPYRYNERELHIHIHMTFFGSNEQKHKLLFRDYLRGHPAEAKTYYGLKKQWSMEAGQDRPKYTKLKTTYIDTVLEKARKEIGD